MPVMLHHIGYKKDRENVGKLVIDKESSKIVKRIFKLRLEGVKCKEIADILNKEKIKTPSEYLHIKGLENRTQKVWTRSIVTRILNNEVYIGKCLRGKTQKINYKSKKRINIRRDEQIVSMNTHEPIISTKEYYAVHNNNKYGNGKKTNEKLDTKFIEYLYCGHCKKKMMRRKQRNYINIYCLNRNETDFLCTNNKLFVYEDIEKVILKCISENFRNYFIKGNNEDRIVKKYNQIKSDKIKNVRRDINKQLSAIQLKISKLYNDRLIGRINETDYKKGYNQLVLKRDEIKEEMKNKIDNICKKKIDLSKYKNLNKDVLTSKEIGELIEKIEVYNEHIHIFFKFESC